MNATGRLCAVLLMLATGGAYAATYYVAPDGKPENDGSQDRPWPSVEHALSRAGGGHTIVLKPGVCRGPIEILKRCAGTEAQPTVVQSEVKWQAVILGAPYHVISNADGDGLTLRSNVVRHNASYGLHLYPSIKNSCVENNLVYGQVRRRGIIVSCPNGGGKNTIVNNTVVETHPLTVWSGKGSPQFAPAKDFWGRQRPTDNAPDLGAFAFEPILVGRQARAGWDNGWPYHRHGNKAGLPDTWALPPAEPAKETQ